MPRRKDLEIEIYSDQVVLKQVFANGKKQVIMTAKTLRELLKKIDGELYEILWGDKGW